MCIKAPFTARCKMGGCFSNEAEEIKMNENHGGAPAPLVANVKTAVDVINESDLTAMFRGCRLRIN
jgi:hypothetical protein